jgi:hypothetical protein
MDAQLDWSHSYSHRRSRACWDWRHDRGDMHYQRNTLDIKSTFPFDPVKNLENRIPFRFSLKNRGKTVARLTGPVKREFILIKHGERLPEVPPYSAKQDFPVESEGVVYGLVIAPEEAQKDIWFSYRVPEGRMEEINSGASKLYVTISVTYFDFAKEKREVQFCLQYWGSGFWPEPNPEQRWQKTHSPDAYNKHT